MTRNYNLLAFCTFVFLVLVFRIFSHGAAGHARSTFETALAAARGSMATGAKGDTGNRDLILYSYFETEDAKSNFLFFRRHALHAKADFIFILNGNYSVDLSETRHLPNVRVVERDNTCLDLGGYHEILTANETLLQHYKRFMWVNASVRGPFFPASADKACWSDVYWDKLDNKTRVAGMTWNCGLAKAAMPPHMQSMIMATDRETMEDIILPNLKCFTDMRSAILEGETVVAANVMEAGFDVYVFEGRFRARATAGYDGSYGAEAMVKWCLAQPLEEMNDILHSGHYEGSTISPYETIFAKSNRPWNDQDRRMIEVLSEHVDLEGYSSYDHCV